MTSQPGVTKLTAGSIESGLSCSSTTIELGVELEWLLVELVAEKEVLAMVLVEALVGVLVDDEDDVVFCTLFVPT